MIIRSTKNCTNTPRVFFALEELGLPYTAERVEDGVFFATYGSPGPLVIDGDTEVIEPGAIARHLVRRGNGALWPTTFPEQAQADRWIEFLSRRLSRVLDKREPEPIERLATFVDKQVATGPWMLGATFSMVDIMYAYITTDEKRALLPLAKLTALDAYLTRITERTAFIRARARYVEANR